KLLSTPVFISRKTIPERSIRKMRTVTPLAIGIKAAAPFSFMRIASCAATATKPIGRACLRRRSIDFVFGSGNGTLDCAVEIVAAALAPPCARAPVLRGYAETMYRANRIEATSLGLDIRYVVTSLAAGSAEHCSRSKSAERYTGSCYGAADSWNLRDRYM